MDLIGGPVIQAALPFVTLLLARHNKSLKMRVITYSEEVDEPNRIIFPAWQCRKLKKGVPKWADFLKGINNYFIRKNKKGLDVIIHSSIPICRGFGSSGALESAFYAAVGGTYDDEDNIINIANAKKCQVVDETFGDSKSGSFSTFTSHLADTKKAVVIDTGENTVEFLDFHDPNILFLLSIPTKDLLQQSEGLIQKRVTELKLAAKLLDLDDIRFAEEQHLEVLASIDDPSPQKVKAILREFEKDDIYIHKFLHELFRLPARDESIFTDEPELFAEDKQSAVTFGSSEDADSEKPPVKGDSFTVFEYKTVCDETICLGGLSDLSQRSDLSVMSKLLRRVRYVVTEKMRVREMMRFITNLDYISAGMEITRSHLSLKADFEVSSPVIDQLVEFTAEFGKGVFGSKMMKNGGTLTLLHRNRAQNLIENITERFGDSFKFYLVFPSRGLRRVNTNPPKVPHTPLSQKYSSVEELMQKAVANFEATYQRYPTHGYCAPGAIKLLGYHSDFNQSYALSMAMTTVTVVVGAYNGSGKIRLATTADFYQQPRKVMFKIPSSHNYKPGASTWANYVRGTIQYFRGSVPGFDCLIESNIPLDDGRITGSASLQVAMYGFLEELTGQYTEDETEKAARCMKGEHDFTYTLRGMDEFIVAIKGLEHKMILVDCKKSTFTYLPSFDPSLVFVLLRAVDALKRIKSLVYMRLEECYDVAKALGLKTLRCATEEDLDRVQGVSETALKRARHIVQEEKRVLTGVQALRKFDPEKFGRLMTDSHISLRDNFEVSHHETDEAVERAMEVEGVLGARMTDRDFGGSILCLAKKWAVDDLIEYIRYSCDTQYHFFVMTPGEGAKRLDIQSYVDSLPGPQKTFETVFGF
ncbi:UNVERIFIED_CONTAM: hypothetical protein PYX00_000027 [Menopon gallinae]